MLGQQELKKKVKVCLAFEKGEKDFFLNTFFQLKTFRSAGKFKFFKLDFFQHFDYKYKHSSYLEDTKLNCLTVVVILGERVKRKGILDPRT